MCFSVRSVCPWVILLLLLLLLGWSAFRLGIWRGKGERSTWRAKCPRACRASCGLGFPAQRLVRHWVAMVGWGPSLQLWLAPRGTCRTLEAFCQANTGECVNLRGGGVKNVAEKWLEIRFRLSYLPSLVTPSSPSSPFCGKAQTTASHLRDGSAKLNTSNHHKPTNSDRVHEPKPTNKMAPCIYIRFYHTKIFTTHQHCETNSGKL